MPVNIRLNKGGQILIMEFIDPWTLEELQIAHSIAYDHLEEALRPLHFISDWTRGPETPPGLMSIRNSSPLFWHPNSGIVALVSIQETPRLLVRRFAEIGIPGTERFHFFEDRAQAEAFLQQVLAQEDRQAHT
jgi:hypothetical protein